MVKILLTSGRAPASLELARLLSSSGHDVYVVDSFFWHLSKNSNAVQKSFHIKRPRQDKKEYLEEINQIIKKYSIDLLIPVYEETFHISLLKDKIVGCPVFVDKIEKLRLLHHKYHFVKLCEKLHLNVPQSLFVDSHKDLKNLNWDSRKTVLKPCFSRYGEEVIISPESFDLKIDLSSESPWVVQQKLEGKQYSTYSICHKGRVLSLSIYPTEITQNKVSLNFKSVQIPSIERWILTFVKEMNYTGQIGFDFFVCDEKAYAIECNPRMTSGLHLFYNFSQITECFTNPESLKSMIKPNNNSQSMFGLPVILYGLTKKGVFKIFLESKDVMFRWNDLRPSFDQFICLFYVIYKSIKNKVTVSQMTTLDIEWNGESS